MSGFHASDRVRSWGGVLQGRHELATPAWLDELPPLLASARAGGMSVLASGLRRSYGDSGLNPNGGLIAMTELNRIVSFDPASRLLSAEAGVSFDAIIRLILPYGLFLPVTPGTRFVTLGGAIANDVHGKNHHRNGTFGRWVRRLSLLCSDGSELNLTPQDRTGLFAATVGGLGLTGIITRAEIELVPVAGTILDSETIPFDNLDAFFTIARESETDFEHTVAWVDCLAKGHDLGRGLFIRANHAEGAPPARGLSAPRLSIPAIFPSMLLNRHSVRGFNALHRWRHGRQRRRREQLASFFYPLDGIANWNRLYGRRGFYQYQSVIPAAAQDHATREMLEAVSASGQGSFLAVLKTFGSASSPGLLSFPRQGTTLALDLPNHGDETLALMERLDDIVLAAGGRLYPAKDGRMPAKLFKAGYPAWQDFAQYVDPGVNSHFWRRVGNG